MTGPKHAPKHARPGLAARLRRRIAPPPRRRLIWVGMPGYQIPMWYTPTAPRGQQWKKAETP